MYIESQIRQYWRFINFWRSKKEAAAPKSRRCICSPQSGDHTLPHRFRTAVLCITAKSAADGRDGSWLCENSSARRARRNISKKLRTMESNRAARTMFDTLLEKF